MSNPEEKLQLGDCILTSPKKFSIISWLIKKITRSKFTHVAMYIGNGHISEFVFKGCIKSTLSKYDNQDYDIKPRRIIGITSNQQFGMAGTAIKDIKIKENYDGLSLLGNAVLEAAVSIFNKPELKEKPNPLDGKGLKCTSGYFTAALAEGIDLFDGKIHYENISPEDINECKKMHDLD